MIRVAVYGAGATGSWFGAALAEGGLDVTLVGRPAHVDQVNARGLVIEDLVTGKARTVHFPSKAVAAFPNDEWFDVILIATKSYDLAAAAAQLSPALETTPACILQNGIGNEEILWEHCPSVRITRVLTSHGVIFKDPGRVTHSGVGKTFIGEVARDSEAASQSDPARGTAPISHLLAKAWNAAGIAVEIVPNIATRVWEKVFVNVGINPFAAIARVPNGELLTDPLMRASMEGAVREAVAVSEKMGVDLRGIDPVGAMFEVAEKTCNNRNSMLQDIEKGKPTEIMFMNGRITAWGDSLGVPTPINSAVTALVKLLESKTRPPKC